MPDAYLPPKIFSAKMLRVFLLAVAVLSCAEAKVNYVDKDKTVMWFEVQPYGTPRQPDPRLKEKGHKGSKSGKGSKAINQPIVSCVTRGGDSCSEGEADGSLSVWAGAPAVGGHGRSAEGQAGSSAASGERPAVARRAGEAYYPEQRGGVRVVPWIKCSQCTDGYMYLECPRCGAEVCRSCSSRCERCQMEECNHCGLHHDYRCRFRRVANGDAITRSKLRHFEGVEAARASARQVAPRLEDSLRLDAVTVAVPLRRAADRAKTTRPLPHRLEATVGP